MPSVVVERTSAVGGKDVESDVEEDISESSAEAVDGEGDSAERLLSDDSSLFSSDAVPSPPMAPTTVSESNSV